MNRTKVVTIDSLPQDSVLDIMQIADSLISKTPGVCGGKARVSGTRIPVWGLENSRRRGLSEFQILQRYPSLSLDGLRAAWDYIALNQTEIEKQISENDQA